MDWTQELKDRVVKEYLAASPTAENGTEIVKAISDGLPGSTVNGVRIILAKAVDAEGNKVYISKASSGAAKTAEKKEGTSKRVNKADAVQALSDLIEENELNLDEDIISKLTGKAAVYFTELLTEIKG